jgi:hypothetical protein
MKPWPRKSMLPKDRLERVIAGLRELGVDEYEVEAVVDYIEGRSTVKFTAEQQKVFQKDFQVLIKLTEIAARRSRDGQGIH